MLFLVTQHVSCRRDGLQSSKAIALMMSAAVVTSTGAEQGVQ